MADEVQRIVGRVTLDTSQATPAARAHARELARLREAQAKLTAAERAGAATAQSLRDETLRLRREQQAAGADKKVLAQRAAEVRLRMAEQAEAARRVRDEQRRLREEQRQLQASMRDTARAARESAREQVAAAREAARAEAQILRDREGAARARRRAEDLAVRERANEGRLQAAGRLDNAAQQRLEATDARLFRLTGRPLGRVRTAAEDAVRGRLDRLGSAEGAAEMATQFGSGIRTAAGMAGRAAVGGALGVGGVVGGIASVGGQFEQLRASLETIEGSKARAEATFRVIQDFAKTTPFSLQEVTKALTLLKAQGLDASVPALKAYGDTASAMGKSLDDMIQAVADAATGEFERLKEFGIKASAQGDKVKFTFKGVETTVKKDAKAIQDYLVSLGRTNFAGGMERQAQTLGGMMSNLGDSVSQLADEAFRSGLGDAIKEVVADITGLTGEGNELAKAIGKTLGDAVRSAWKWVRDLVGPVDQLDDKFREAGRFGSEFADLLRSAVGAAVSLTGALGGSTTAVVALGAAFVGLTGPIGAAVAVAVLAGREIGKAFTAADESLRKLHQRAEEIRDREHEDAKQDIRREIDQERREDEQRQRVKEAGFRVRDMELRRLGKSVEELSPAERRALRRKVEGTMAGLSGQGAFGSRAFGGGDFESRLAEFERTQAAGGADADRAELKRLIARRKSLSPSEKKRLGELSKELDVSVPRAGGKEKLDAFSAERKKEIDDLVRRAELEAADRAIASGDVRGAGRAAKEGGREARKRLEDLASRGALPGEVERSLLRRAGFSDVEHAPPPPVVVYQQTFNLKVDLGVAADVKVEGDPEAVAVEIGEATQTVLERDILPRVADLFRGSIRR